jgi:hypothetical protein
MSYEKGIEAAPVRAGAEFQHKFEEQGRELLNRLEQVRKNFRDSYHLSRVTKEELSILRGQVWDVLDQVRILKEKMLREYAQGRSGTLSTVTDKPSDLPEPKPHSFVPYYLISENSPLLRLDMEDEDGSRIAALINNYAESEYFAVETFRNGESRNGDHGLSLQGLIETIEQTRA